MGFLNLRGLGDLFELQRGDKTFVSMRILRMALALWMEIWSLVIIILLASLVGGSCSWRKDTSFYEGGEENDVSRTAFDRC
jgi:hypothetical protein